MQMSGADIVVEYLNAEGVTHVFGVSPTTSRS